MTDADRRLASVGRALDLVEERLRDDLDVAALASAACYSIFHFVRVFTELTGHGPYDYLMRRRVAEAARELVSGDRSILELALDYRFESPDGFSRAFRRCYGLAPSEARKAGAFPDGSARTPITREYVHASMNAGLTIRAERLSDVLVSGRSLAPGEAAGSEARLMILGTGRDAFAGRAADEVPDYPTLGTRVPGGDCIVASGQPPLDLGLARERLYRTAIPVGSARVRADFELIRLDSGGGPIAILVPVLLSEPLGVKMGRGDRWNDRPYAPESRIRGPRLR
ncbi:MAG TPA: AraC family transcriptional regulator [Spirochaetales bacterium]|nr:AraC family transcriptional regulator [Spirochaetales bacterium]HPG85072.1 AraC family transcriptional regulator [Spirochaetales bacterium]HPM72718.1 AraC family transcriptional regulator [Spirochaetales bacterium]